MAFGAAAMAQTPAGPAGASTRGPGQFLRITGKLIKIDGKALTIAVTDNGATKDVVVNCVEQTRFFKAAVPPAGEGGQASEKAAKGRISGPPAKFEDLKVGQEVMAAYNVADGNARMVRIAAEAAAPASGAGEATTTTK
jgi:hypothetical protein